MALQHILPHILIWIFMVPMITANELNQTEKIKASAINQTEKIKGWIKAIKDVVYPDKEGNSFGEKSETKPESGKGPEFLIESNRNIIKHIVIYVTLEPNEEILSKPSETKIRHEDIASELNETIKARAASNENLVKQFPFMVRVRPRVCARSCTGVIITKMKVLTAASCFRVVSNQSELFINWSMFDVIAEAGLGVYVTRRTTSHWIHPNFTFLTEYLTYKNNIAILTVDNPFPSNDKVHPMAYSTDLNELKQKLNAFVTSGVECVVLSFGGEQSLNNCEKLDPLVPLHKTDVTCSQNSNQDCINIFDDYFIDLELEPHVCVEAESAIGNVIDPGSPLVCEGLVTGFFIGYEFKTALFISLEMLLQVLLLHTEKSNGTAASVSYDIKTLGIVAAAVATIYNTS